MSKRNPNDPPLVDCGPEDVGLLALHDRDFFEELLRDPQGAMDRQMIAGRLRISEEGRRQVEELVRERQAMYPDRDALRLWDRYHQSGDWECEDWPHRLWARIPMPPLTPGA
ncbi:MAG TPA: hypothetical protein VMN60_01530 [Longimicrobiales bacterium]|nr:hypothetical protein [Longimicrobiales bacterium]